MKKNPIVFGIGNPLVDIIYQSTESDIKNLGLKKGSMQLVTEQRQDEIIEYFKFKSFSGKHPALKLQRMILFLAQHLWHL